MRIRAVIFFAVFLIAGLAMSPSARAAGFEITPFAGHTWGGDFTDAVTGKTIGMDDTASYGIMLDFNQAEDTWIELYFSRQQTSLKLDQGTFPSSTPLLNVDVEYFHVGGTYGEASGKVKPFVVGTFGVTHMTPKEEGLDSVTKFSLSLGGGVKLFVNDRVGLRLEGRWFGTLFDGSGEAFCANGACAVKVQGDLFSQYVANAGLIIAF
jgi:hypothetical protein